MLPSELLRTRIHRGRITPLFCTVGTAGNNNSSSNSSTDHGLASRIITLFAGAQKGRQRKGDLMREIGSLEAEHDYKLVRGLSALLERRCVFGRSNESLSSAATPMLVRRKLFEESARRGLALSDSQRQDIVQQTAERMHVLPDDVEGIMWSDMDENLVTTGFDAIGAKDLILWYNLSLFQTLLFRCARLEFYVRGGAHWKDVLRNVKRYGLMYSLEYHPGNDRDGDDDSVRCVLEGPLSLFKMTDRYGTSMAKLLPSIVRTPEWEITGSLVKRTDDGQKVYSFGMSSKNAGQFLGQTVDPANRDGGNSSGSGGGRAYDSSVEEAFAKKFYQHFDQGDKLGWRISREPDPLVADGKAMIPDFLFERFGRKVYFEIVGFWTKEYLDRKAAKLRALLDGDGKNREGAVDLLVAINSELACSRIEAISRDRIFTFRKEVSIKPVLEHLRRIDAEIVEEKSRARISLGGGSSPDLISVKQVALENSLPEAAALKIILADHPGGYVPVGPYLVSMGKVKAADDSLGGVSRFVDACRILASQKIPDSCHADLLSEMGYDVVWEDLNPDNARISKGGR